MAILIRYPMMTYNLSVELIDNIFFSTCIECMQLHNETSINLLRYEDVFVAINTNTLNKLIESIYKSNRINILDALSKIKQGIDYFQYDIDKFISIAETIDDEYYKKEVNYYIASCLRKNPNIVLDHNEIFTEEFHHEFNKHINYTNLNHYDIINKQTPINYLIDHYTNKLELLIIYGKIDLSGKKFYSFNNYEQNIILSIYSDFKYIDDSKLLFTIDEVKRLVINPNLPKWFIEKNYGHFLKTSYTNKIIMEVLVEKKFMDTYLIYLQEYNYEFLYCSEFVPIDLLIKYPHRFDMFNLYKNVNVTTNDYFKIPFTIDQYENDLWYNNKLPMEFIENNIKNMYYFNPVNKNLTNEFILKHLHNICNSQEILTNWKITNSFAEKIYAIVSTDVKKYSTIIRYLTMNKYISYELAYKFWLLIYTSSPKFLSVDDLEDITSEPTNFNLLQYRYEFVQTHISYIQHFTDIPLQIFIDFGIFTHLDKIAKSRVALIHLI
jgi:hypothetical protein